MADAPDKKSISFVNERFTSAKAASSLDFERFARYYKLFRNRQTKKNYVGLANLFVPEPYRIVRKKTAKLANAVRSISGIPEGEEDKEAAGVASELINFLRRKLNWHMTERLAIQESRIVGLSWIKALWLIGKEEEDKPYKGFDLSMATADQVFLPPGTTILDVFEGNIPWLIHEYETDLESIEANANYSTTEVSRLKQSGGGSGMQSDASPLTQARGNYLMSNKKGNKPKKYKVREYWGEYTEIPDDPEADKIKGPRLIVIANEMYELRNDENPYSEILDNPIPFVPIVANPVGEELYPIGDIEPAESLFNELNDSRNQRMDTVTLNIDPPKEILKSAQIDKKQLVAKRGWYIESAVPGGVRFIPPDMQGVVASINEEKIIRADIQQVTGSIDFSGGETTSGVEVDTARGALIAKGEADVITEDEIEVLKVSLRMLYRIVIAYSQKFLDREFTIRVVKDGVEEFKNVSNDSIQGNIDVDILIRTLQDKTTDQSLQLMLFNQAKTVPGAKLGRFFTDVLQSFKEDVNVADYYEEPQPPPPESPKISISLKGDLSELQSAEIYKTIPGVDPAYADPITLESGRRMLRGDLPELKQEKVAAEIGKIQADTAKTQVETVKGAKELSEPNEPAETQT